MRRGLLRCIVILYLCRFVSNLSLIIIIVYKLFACSLSYKQWLVLSYVCLSLIKCVFYYYYYYKRVCLASVPRRACMIIIIIYRRFASLLKLLSGHDCVNELLRLLSFKWSDVLPNILIDIVSVLNKQNDNGDTSNKSQILQVKLYRISIYNYRDMVLMFL